MRVLMVTSEWPTPAHPEWVPFLVRQAESLRKAGVDVQVFPFRGSKNPILYLGTWFRLRQQHRLADYDLIHAQFGQSGLVALPAPVPVVVTFHGSDLQGFVEGHGRQTFSGRILAFLSKWVASRASAVIVVSQPLAERLKRRSHIIPCGVDLELFQPMDQAQARAALGWPETGKIALFVGDPDNPIKRYALAKQAVDLTRQSVAVAMITATGVPHERMPLCLNAADLLLVTSHHEGSPTVVKEALACNLPIVSVDVGDVRERIGGIEGCVVCEDRDPATLRDALMKVLASNKRLQSRERIKATLDEAVIAQKIIDVYRSVLP